MEVKLYLVDARTLAEHQGLCLSLLTAQRRQQAESFVEEKDRLLGCAAGLLLRHVLNVTKDEDLICNEYGKPELVSGQVQFSLSHAGCYAALAVGHGIVGADIEPHVKPSVLPRKVLTGEEMVWLEEHPSAEDFCLLWTRLESALKAEGCGLAVEERNFSLLEECKPWHWETFVHDGHTVTCAAMEDMKVDLVVLPAHELLK